MGILDPKPPTRAELSATYLDKASGLSKTEATAKYAQKSYATGAFGAALQTLEDGNDLSITVQGDSTGNESDEWVHLVGQWLASQYPDAHVRERIWEPYGYTGSLPEVYGNWNTIQAGANGQRHALFNSTDKTMLCPAEKVTAITGDIDVRVKAAADTWLPTATQNIVARQGGAGLRSFTLGVNSTGRAVFTWSSDGTNSFAAVSTGGALPFTNGTAHWLRATLDVDNGTGGYTVTLYRSEDAETWTNIGTTTTTTGTTSIFNAVAQPYEIGGRSGASDKFMGKIYDVEIRAGIGGPIRNPQPIDSWLLPQNTSPNTQPVFAGSRTIHIWNGSRPGADMNYLTDTWRRDMMLPPVDAALAFLSCSHNDQGDTGSVISAKWDAWLAHAKTKLPTAAFVVNTQNPQILPTVPRREHLIRRRQIMTWAARNGAYAIDAYAAFLADGRPMTDLIKTDGLHPSPAGSQVWANAVISAFQAKA
jgi:lysophospholipase L1-like esterase